MNNQLTAVRRQSPRTRLNLILQHIIRRYIDSAARTLYREAELWFRWDATIAIQRYIRGRINNARFSLIDRTQLTATERRGVISPIPFERLHVLGDLPVPIGISSHFTISNQTDLPTPYFIFSNETEESYSSLPTTPLSLMANIFNAHTRRRSRNTTLAFTPNTAHHE